MLRLVVLCGISRSSFKVLARSYSYSLDSRGLHILKLVVLCGLLRTEHSRKQESAENQGVREECVQGHRTSGTSTPRFLTFQPSGLAGLGPVRPTPPIPGGSWQKHGKCRKPGGTSGMRAGAQDFRDVHPQILHFPAFQLHPLVSVAGAA